MTYQVLGRLLEVCSCGAQCPCRTTGERDSSDCQAVNAWQVDRGTIDGTDVSGLALVTISRQHGHVVAGRDVHFYVDERATAAQEMALLAVWKGERGGPLADVAQLIGKAIGVERAAIAFEVQDGRGSL